MSLLTLSKRILGKDAKKAPARNKKLKSVATSAAKKKQPVDAHALTSGRIGLMEVVSEKGILQQEQNTVVFKVLRHVTKGQIAAAIESRYGVHVLSVRTALSHPRIRRRGITEGVTNQYKKAYVRVDNVQSIVSHL
ncbi:MAG TPA: 50S ribosomal protein L23 [Candidatus Andersenbacteria bacterium]|nr:50S ribosomal protein L23 [Candidatus Andersenbacteria bacterium]